MLDAVTEENMKKILAIALSCLFVLSMSVGVFAAEPQETTQIGGKTYYIIKTAEQFESMHGDNNYVLGGDIDLGGKVYTQYVVPALFSGILNGNGHSLLNFSFATENSGVGIFNMAYNTDAEGNVLTNAEDGTQVAAEGYTFTIQNLTVGSETSPVKATTTATNFGILSGYVADSNVLNISGVKIYADISSSNQQAAGFFGRVMTNRQKNFSTFTDCELHGSITGSGANRGAFIAYGAYPVNFVSCANYADITTGSANNCGGFVGTQYSGVYCKLNFEKCANYGKIEGTNCIGGFTGKMQYSVNLSDCVNYGDVAATGTHVGGLVAYEKNTTEWITGTSITLERCTNNGDVSSTAVSGSTNMGGLVGSVNENLTVTGCTNNGDVTVISTKSGGSYVGGIVGLVSPQTTGAEYESNGETKKYKNSETYTYSISNTVNNGDVSYKTVSSGSTGGIVGGTTWNGIYCTMLVDRCTNNGNITDTSTAGAASRVSGIVGRFEKSAGILKITNCLNSGTLKGTSNDTVGAMLGYTNATTNCTDETTAQLEEGVLPVIRLAENCINLGTLYKGESTEGTYAVGKNYLGFGDVVNCYTVSAIPTSDDSEVATVAEGDEGDGETVTEPDPREYILMFHPDATGAAVIATEAQLASGEIAYALGAAFGQALGTEMLPSVGGNAVLMNANGEIYNQIHDHDFEGSAYEKLNAGSHVRLCTVCGEKVSEAHVYDGFTDNGDGTHKKVCKHCGYESSAQPHVCEKYSDGGDGTHSGMCTSCGASVKAEHSYEEGTCVDCGAVQGAQTDVTDTEATETEDIYAGKKPGTYLQMGSTLIPLGVVIGIGIAAVAVIAGGAVTAVLLIKKKKLAGAGSDKKSGDNHEEN